MINHSQVILEAVQVAQRRGAFSLEEAAQIWESVKALTVPVTESPVNGEPKEKVVEIANELVK